MDIDHLPMAKDGRPLIEAKLGMVFYLPSPLNREVVGDVLRICFARFGKRIRSFRSTALGDVLHDWRNDSEAEFLTERLPQLYVRSDWGYMFSDGLPAESWQFAFHGYRSASEPGRSSFVRMDFDRRSNADEVKDVACQLMECFPFLSGFAGLYWQARTRPNLASDSFDAMFSLANRYEGIEAHNLDVTVRHTQSGMKCVNWLTFIGKSLVDRFQQQLKDARQAAFAHFQGAHGTMLQASPAPLIGDRNRGDRLESYRHLASALHPLQMPHHESFGGKLWTDENTTEYVQRFTRLKP